MRIRPTAHRAAPFVVAIALVATIVTFASSAVTTLTDPNDTAGRLDVRRIHYEWTPGAAPTWQVRTFGRWTARIVWDSGYTWVEFDTRLDARADFYVMVFSNGRRIRGALFEILPSHDRLVRYVDIRRPDRATVVLRMSWSALEFGPARETFRWWVTTSFTSDECPRSCIDVAPDDGGVEEWIPGMSPSPTTTTTTTSTTTTTTTTTTTSSSTETTTTATDTTTTSTPTG